jgi:uncharacterized protein
VSRAPCSLESKFIVAGFNEIFLDEDGVLRSGWRVAIFLFFYSLLLGLVAGSLQLIIAGIGAHETLPPYFFWLASGLLGLGVALFVGWQCGKRLEHVPFQALGASFSGNWLAHLSLGLVAGTATVLIALAIAFLFGGERFALNTGSSNAEIGQSLLISLAVFAAAAGAEEALFRGYILQTLDRSGFAWLAILLTSATFGIVHLGNPNAGAISTLNTILAGVWFGIAYLRFRNLWFVTGMHLMWNWVQGSVFGVEVSGLRDITAHPLLYEIDHGPSWLTGETYGIEGGIAATMAIILSSAVVAKAPRREI